MQDLGIEERLLIKGLYYMVLCIWWKITCTAILCSVLVSGLWVMSRGIYDNPKKGQNARKSLSSSSI
jgi:hypothetical protein